jgi:PAS domain S-box-containing protein
VPVEVSRARLEEIRYALDQAAIVAVTDQRGTITYANDKFCEISKYSRDELLGQDHRIINSSYHSKEFMRDLWRTIAQGRVWRGELRNRAKDGSFYWVDTTIVPFLDARGKPRQYLAIRSDITRRKEAEAQLASQAALAQLGQLAAVVAHEVRNPLAGVRGSLEVLRSRLSGLAMEREVIQAMIDRLDALNAKVDDILRFAQPRSPVLRVVEVSPVVEDVVSSAQAAIGDGCPPIAFSPQPLAVRADPELLRAALLNLVLNACQAGGDGVEIKATATGDVCAIAVLDRGPGIPEDIADRVFEAFYTTKKSGTGLGLPIVKRLMDLQQGTVTLRKREGGGTVAEISVPMALATAMPVTRREALLALAAVPLAARRSATAAQQASRETELIACGWDEVFILALGEGPAPPHRKAWSWRAADSPEIPADMHALFRTTDDCKPVDGGRRILISSSGGAVALVDRETRRASFSARVTNAHSIDMLPGGRIAAAASVSTTGSGNRLVIFDAATGKELASDQLRSAHGALWDDARSVLWALGGDVLRAYSVGPAGGPTNLERTFEIALPDEGGHDLVAIPGSSRLFLSTVRRAYSFDRERRQLSPHDELGARPNIKSYNLHPRTGRVVYIQAEGSNWWAEHLHFQHPDGTLRLPGEHLYKARWIG